MASFLSSRRSQPAAADTLLPLEQFSPSFLGMYRKGMEIDGEIKKFTDWMLADLSSEGPAPTTALTSVVVKDCLFTDCKGSFAIRGLQAQPIESVSIVGNKWAYTEALDASSLHPSFWNCFEANNTKGVVVKHNEAAITRLGGNGVRGFFQTWSKADVHYVLQFEKNTLSGFDYAVQIAANSNFYSPDQKDTRLLVKSEPGKITDTRFGMALFYPWDDTVTGAWNPIDVARFPTAVTTDFSSRRCQNEGVRQHIGGMTRARS